jgi:hypothetical protein
VQWCLCEGAMMPGVNTCAPCQTTSDWMCYPR